MALDEHVQADGLPVLIVGGGIAGLTAALALHKVGCPVEVFETAAAWRAQGDFGILLRSEATAVLESFGLVEALQAPDGGDAVRTSFRQSLNAAGNVLAEETIKHDIATQYMIRRGALLRVLADAVEARLGASRLHFSHCFERLEQDLESVTVYFQGGQAVRGCAVVGCDGCWSKVRKQIFPDAPNLRYSGWTAFRGLCELPAQFGDGNAVAMAGQEGVTFVQYPVAASIAVQGGTLANWAVVVEAPLKHERPYPATLRDLEAVRDWTVEIAGLRPWDVAQQSQLVELEGWPLFDLDPLERWTVGRATLLGDAAHPMLPFGAAGATSAVQDAAALGDACSAATAGSAEWFQAFESARLPAGRQSVFLSRDTTPQRGFKISDAAPIKE